MKIYPLRGCRGCGFRHCRRCFAAPSSVAADWKPDKPIEFIVGTGPGSGVDNTARTVQAILQTQKLVEPQINVVNKPGGPYAIAFNYLAAVSGRRHPARAADAQHRSRPW